MRGELQQQLFDKYPAIFRQRNLPPQETTMCWGIECGDGWFTIIDTLCDWLTKMRVFTGAQVEAEQVKEKFGCYDGETEILTRDGWKKFSDVTYDDEVATLKGGKFLEYETPTDIIEYDYDGEMYKLKTRGVDLLVTSNHQLYVSKGTYWNGRYKPPKKVEYPFELVDYKKYYGENKRFKKGAVWKGKEIDIFVLPKYENYWMTRTGKRNKICPEKEIDMDCWLTFLGWYVAEGCSNTERGEIAIACNNTDGGGERKTIMEVIESIGYKVKTTFEDKPALIFKIYRKQLAIWLSSNCGSVSYKKKVPNFIKELSPRQIEIFLNSLYAGDGHKTDTAYILTTVSKQLADDVQELLLKVGYSSRIYGVRQPRGTKQIKGKRLVYEINWLKKSNYHNTSNKGLAKSSEEGMIDYKGKVYCVTVPSHIIYVRRNGIPVWCGNSLRFYYSIRNCKTTDMSFPVIKEMITFIELYSEKVCEICGQLGELSRCDGWYKTVCEKHRKEHGYTIVKPLNGE